MPFEIGQSLVEGWTSTTMVQGSAVPQVFIPRLVDLYEKGRFPFEELIQHYPLAEGTPRSPRPSPGPWSSPSSCTDRLH